MVNGRCPSFAVIGLESTSDRAHDPLRLDNQERFVIESDDARMHSGYPDREEPLERFPHILGPAEDRLEHTIPVVVPLDDLAIVCEVGVVGQRVLGLTCLYGRVPLAPLRVQHTTWQLMLHPGLAVGESRYLVNKQPEGNLESRTI